MRKCNRNQLIRLSKRKYFHRTIAFLIYTIFLIDIIYTIVIKLIMLIFILVWEIEVQYVYFPLFPTSVIITRLECILLPIELCLSDNSLTSILYSVEIIINHLLSSNAIASQISNKFYFNFAFIVQKLFLYLVWWKRSKINPAWSDLSRSNPRHQSE